MDGRNFDELTKRLAKGASRRSLLKALLGGAGAAAVSTVIGDVTLAQTGQIGDPCPNGDDDCQPDLTCGPGQSGCQCDVSEEAMSQCPGSTETVGKLEGECCQGNGNCCTNNCVENWCGAATTTTAAPTTTTGEPTTTTVVPTTTTGVPTTTTGEPTTTTGEPTTTTGVPTTTTGEPTTTSTTEPATTTTTTEPTTTTTTTEPTTTTTSGPICLEAYELCTFNEQCCSGCCDLNLQIGVAPNKYCLPSEFCECRQFGEQCGLIINGTYLAGGGAEQLDCCDGLLCCHYDEGVNEQVGLYCAECCNDHHCDKGHHCCHGQCISDDVCCTDRDCDDCEECRQGECVLTGVPFGEYCGMIGLAEGESPQLDCCDGLVCCEVDKDGNRCFECCGDWDCPKGTECRHGVCEFECKHDKDCPDGTCCCKSGHCSKHCCDDHKKPQDPGEPAIDTLPSTGSGDTASGAGWLGAAALGAAAFAVGKTLRDGVTAVPEATSEE